MLSKKSIFLWILFLCLILSSGCETTKRVTAGVGTTVGGAASGIAKDSQNFWQTVLKADSWIKRNLW